MVKIVLSQMKPISMVMLFSFVAPFGAAAALVTTWFADRDPPVIHDSYWLEPKVVERCETIKLFVKRYALRQAGVKLYITLRDSDHGIYTPDLPALPELRGQLGEDTFSIPVEVPCSFVPGVATLTHRFNFRRNPLQAEGWWPITLPQGTIKFCIKPDGGQPTEECRKASGQGAS